MLDDVLYPVTLVVSLLLYTAVIAALLDDLGASHRWASRLARVLGPVANPVFAAVSFANRSCSLLPGRKRTARCLEDALSVSRAYPCRASRVVSKADIDAFRSLRPLGHLSFERIGFEHAGTAHPVSPRTSQALVSRASVLADAPLRQSFLGHDIPEFPTTAFATVASYANDPTALAELFSSPVFDVNIADLDERQQFRFGDVERLIGGNPHLQAAHLAASRVLTTRAALSLLRAAAEHGRELLSEHLGVPFTLTDTAGILLSRPALPFAEVLATLDDAVSSSPLASTADGWSYVLTRMVGRSQGELICDYTITEAAAALEELAAASSPAAVTLAAELLKAGAPGPFEDLALAVRHLLGPTAAS